MKRKWFVHTIIVSILIAFPVLGLAASKVTSSAVPLPPALSGIPTINAVPWVQIDPGPQAFLEGPAFDREGNLFIVSVFASKILKITPDKKVTTIYTQQGLMPVGLAFHKDGRLFAVNLSGKILSLNPDGTNPQEINVKVQGKPIRPNDCVFDLKGNLYVTDWWGHIADPIGGVYRYSADFKTVQPVVQGLAAPNGIGLAPEGNVLWVAEMLRNGLLRIGLQKDGVTLPPITPLAVTYYFSGFPGPDGMAVDAKGHVYQAMNFQGRVVILRGGMPVAQVLIPGRDEGKYLRVTNMAFKPGTSEVYITLSGKGGAWIYTFRGLAEGLKLFSHQ